MKQNYNSLVKELKKSSSPARAKVSQWFFKTGKGEYGEGDVFWGLTVPQMRVIGKKFIDLPFADIAKLLKSPVHEQRFVALVILVLKFQTRKSQQKKVFGFYVSNTKYINNWDLVDTSAPYILGPVLLNVRKDLLYKWVKSKNIWERRIAIVTTQHFIRHGKFEDTLKLAKILLTDKHDLIHKASGWMLREVGKKNEKVLIKFLNANYLKMPRTMLRYSVERLSPKLKLQYLKK